ncbi:hypothetical protein [Actibacterium sp. MT2.3-13A]|uniref:hypothetical protein n=1 Tax=Actibacterium sp. MT2.3-13A TaxID=2828332 RepID=UPI001BA93C2F|nr:hypothetical protein [Actibacterium sp. MT2.3-13A]
MKAIHPNLFTQVMKFPDSVRADLLEFLGATPVEDAQLKQMIADVAARLDDSAYRGFDQRLPA